MPVHVHVLRGCTNSTGLRAELQAGGGTTGGGMKGRSLIRCSRPPEKQFPSSARSRCCDTDPTICTYLNHSHTHTRTHTHRRRVTTFTVRTEQTLNCIWCGSISFRLSRAPSSSLSSLFLSEGTFGRLNVNSTALIRQRDTSSSCSSA